MANPDGHPTFPIVPSMVLITTACAAGVAIAAMLAVVIGTLPTAREAVGAGVIVAAVGFGSLLILNRLASHGLNVLALGQVALSMVRVLAVIVTAVVWINSAQLNPVPTTICVAMSYLTMIIAEAVWVGRRVVQFSIEPGATGSLS
jgi:hypothetical protein